MKTKTLKIILAAIALVSFVLAVYCIVVSLKGTGGKWANNQPKCSKCSNCPMRQKYETNPKLL